MEATPQAAVEERRANTTVAETACATTPATAIDAEPSAPTDDVNSSAMSVDDFTDAREEFGTPSRIPATMDDLSMLETAGNNAFKDLSRLRQSLYTRFDPLASPEKPATTTTTTTTTVATDGSETTTVPCVVEVSSAKSTVARAPVMSERLLDLTPVKPMETAAPERAKPVAFSLDFDEVSVGGDANPVEEKEEKTAEEIVPVEAVETNTFDDVPVGGGVKLDIPEFPEIEPKEEAVSAATPPKSAFDEQPVGGGVKMTMSEFPEEAAKEEPVVATPPKSAFDEQPVGGGVKMTMSEFPEEAAKEEPVVATPPKSAFDEQPVSRVGKAVAKTSGMSDELPVGGGGGAREPMHVVKETSALKERVSPSPVADVTPFVGVTQEKTVPMAEATIEAVAVVAAPTAVHTDSALVAQLEATQAKLASEQQQNKELVMLLSDYEATIARMIEDGEGQKRRDEETRRRLGEEKEQALDDLRGVETAFSDLHRRYERLKEIIDTFQKNETILRSNVSQAQESLAQSERRYVALKEHAEGKIDAANDEIERVRGSQKNEMTVMAAKLKKAEMRVSSLERTVKDKEAENAELMKICDELIAKVDQ